MKAHERTSAQKGRQERGVALVVNECGGAALIVNKRGGAALAVNERGVAALVVIMGMLFAMVLVTAFANRNLVFEQRTSANQYRAAQAFEAAEAGIEWALAQLNANRRIGADCEPSADPAATSFRTRYLSTLPKTGVLIPKTWSNAGTAAPLSASCVRAGGGWSCSCSSDGAPVLSAPGGKTPAPAFLVHFTPTAQPGLVRIVSQGCTGLAGKCAPGSTTRADASAKVEALLGVVAGMRTPPAATVTTRGSFDAGAAPIGLHNPDPATGIAVNAGGTVTATQARLTPPAGAPIVGMFAADDAALAALAADHFFASHFGVDRAAWRGQPAVTRVSCSIDCATVLGAAIAAAEGPALIHVDGDLSLAGPIALGSVQQPVVIVVAGAAGLEGAVTLHGVLHAASLAWNNTSGGAFVRGALLSEGGYAGNGAPDLFYDPALLARLKHATGSFARVHGSWRDF